MKNLTPYDIFIANIEAGNDKELLIKDVVESYGLKIYLVSRPCSICAVSALENVFDHYGYETLSRTLRLIIGSWEGNQQSLGGAMIKGVARLIAAYDMEIKDEIFIEKLSDVSAKEIIRSARERRGGTIGYTEAILAVYNRKLRNPLSIDRVYSAKKRK